MSRALGPHPPLAAGNAYAGWAVLAGCWGLIAVFGLVWLAAWIAAAVTGGHVAGFGADWVVDLLRGRTSRTWPGTPSLAVGVAAGALATAVAAATLTAWQVVIASLPAPGDAAAALADDPGVRPLTAASSARTAVRLRPSLAGANLRKLDLSQVGLVLGDLRRPGGQAGPTLLACWEDTLLSFMGPRTPRARGRPIPRLQPNHRPPAPRRRRRHLGPIQRGFAGPSFIGVRTRVRRQGQDRCTTGTVNSTVCAARRCRFEWR